jgi:hypothetical protein
MFAQADLESVAHSPDPGDVPEAQEEFPAEALDLEPDPVAPVWKLPGTVRVRMLDEQPSMAVKSGCLHFLVRQYRFETLNRVDRVQRIRRPPVWMGASVYLS